MRISDWSADVCSSDLQVLTEDGDPYNCRKCGGHGSSHGAAEPYPGHRAAAFSRTGLCGHDDVGDRGRRRPLESHIVESFQVQGRSFRSEEHTSELQSLMRTSSAVMCLKKKNIIRLRLTPDTETLASCTSQRPVSSPLYNTNKP